VRGFIQWTRWLENYTKDCRSELHLREEWPSSLCQHLHDVCTTCSKTLSSPQPAGQQQHHSRNQGSFCTLTFPSW
jgi:hypothetical protein